VPDVTRGMAEQPYAVDGVLIAIRRGKLENGEIHDFQNHKGTKAQSKF